MIETPAPGAKIGQNFENRIALPRKYPKQQMPEESNPFLLILRS